VNFFLKVVLQIGMIVLLHVFYEKLKVFGSLSYIQMLLLVSCDQFHLKIGVHKLSKNLGYTSKFSAPEGWHEASSILRTHIY
jgi:hypothetical protein